MPVHENRSTIEVPGKGPVSVATLLPPDAFATICLFHGAGAGLDHPFMSGFARAAADAGIATLRCNFPYMEAGSRSPDRQPVAIATVRALFEEASRNAPPGQPVWLGGKSFGGRMASLAVAEGLGAHGLVFLGYPMHPPGKPERVRDEHLYGLDVPMLFVQGTKDPFATAAVLDPVLANLPRGTVHRVEGGGHSLERSRAADQADVAASLVPVVADFLREHP